MSDDLDSPDVRKNNNYYDENVESKSYLAPLNCSVIERQKIEEAYLNDISPKRQQQVKQKPVNIDLPKIGTSQP